MVVPLSDETEVRCDAYELAQGWLVERDLYPAPIVEVRPGTSYIFPGDQTENFLADMTYVATPLGHAVTKGTGGEWTGAPAYASSETTFTDSSADFQAYMVGWLLQPDVELPSYLEIVEVVSATAIKVKGDADTLASAGSTYRIHSPPGVSVTTGALITGLEEAGSRWLWAGYDYAPPMVGFHNPEGQDPGTYGAQSGGNRLGSYHCWHRVYEPATGRWTTPDPAMTPWANLFCYCSQPPLGSDPTGLSGGYIGHDSDGNSIWVEPWDTYGTDQDHESFRNEALRRMEEAARNGDLQGMRMWRDIAAAASRRVVEREMSEARRGIEEMERRLAALVEDLEQQCAEIRAHHEAKIAAIQDRLRYEKEKYQEWYDAYGAWHRPEIAGVYIKKNNFGTGGTGHWWIECGKEGYGLSNNGQVNHGLPRDPNYGTEAEFKFVAKRRGEGVLIYGSGAGKSCREAGDGDVKDCIRTFAKQYVHAYDLTNPDPSRGRHNCRTWLNALMDACCITIDDGGSYLCDGK